MPFALHGMCSLHNNIVSDIRLAKETDMKALKFTRKNSGAISMPV